MLADNFPTVTIVVLSYNSREHLDACFSSLKKLDYSSEQLELLLVDNASTDGSADFVEQHFPTVQVLRNQENLGFDAGNNVGARHATGTWVAFLNPDMRVSPDWLVHMLEVALADVKTVCVGSRLLSWDGKSIDFGGAAMNFYGHGMQEGFGQRDLKNFAHEKDILFPCGGAFIIRKDIFMEVGGLDEDFFSFFEDVDLGWRLWVLGYQVRYAGRATVYHIHHGSWGKAPQSRRLALSERNALYTIFKNYDDQSLRQVWPASVMLLVRRAFTTSGLDADRYRISASLPQLIHKKWTKANPRASEVKNFAYYWREIKIALREGGLGAVALKFKGEFVYRWQNFMLYIDDRFGYKQPQAAGSEIHMPQVTLSYLHALRDLVADYDALREKRRLVQAARQCADQDIFPLFQRELIPNYLDRDYNRTFHIMCALWDLYDLFGVEI